MLSLSNISLFVLSDRFRGYYIHGKSVHGHADTDMIEMNENLKKEETDQVPRRGLESGSDSQMFEVFLTQQVRDMYDKVYMLLMAEKAKMMQLPSRRGASSFCLFQLKSLEIPATRKFATDLTFSLQTNSQRSRSPLNLIRGQSPRRKRTSVRTRASTSFCAGLLSVTLRNTLTLSGSDSCLIV